MGKQPKTNTDVEDLSGPKSEHDFSKMIQSIYVKKNVLLFPNNFRVEFLILDHCDRVGYKSDPNDQPLDVFLRKLAVNWACSLGNEDCIEKAEEDFKVWMDKRLPDAEEGNP